MIWLWLLEESSKMAMAITGEVAMVMVVCCCSWALLIHSAVADGNSEFLDYINQYRISISLPAFTANTGAACVAQQVAIQYKDTACTNTTGTDTVSGQEQQLSESLLNKCNLQLANIKDGFIGPSCVPTGTSAADAPKLAAANITDSQAYTAYVNDTQYVSAGSGSDNNWYVLVLATNTSGGNFVNQNVDPAQALALSVSFAPLTILICFVFALLQR